MLTVSFIILFKIQPWFYGLHVWLDEDELVRLSLQSRDKVQENLYEKLVNVKTGK